MLDHLQIYDRRDRMLVGLADAGLRLAAPALRGFRRQPARSPRRILLLRLERIGDLLMSLEAIEDVCQAAPSAEIDLVVGSWNVDLARRIRGLNRVVTLDASWLSRDANGLSLPAMIRTVHSWKKRQYDLAVNFEPDIRSNIILAAVRADRMAGFSTGGGGPLLDVALACDPAAHTSKNARRVIAAALDVPVRTTRARLELTADERARARQKLAGVVRPAIGMHVSGGRPVKQWDAGRFAELALRLALARGATIVLTGSGADRPLVAPVAAALGGSRVLDLVGEADLPTLAALLEQLDVLVTGDTGPMHLGAAVGTPVVAIFGPSDPARYAPQDPIHRIVRIDLPCSPCNRIRLPPARCAGHTPDCLTGIDVDVVYRAVEATLDARQRPPARTGSR